MSASSFNSVGVIGAGQMGSGIAQVLATYGIQVVVFDIDQGQLDKAKAGIQGSLGSAMLLCLERYLLLRGEAGILHYDGRLLRSQLRYC